MNAEGTAPPAVRRAPGIGLRRTSRSVIALGSGPAATLLRGSALEVWEALDEWITVDKLAELIAARHGLTAEQALADLVPFIEELGAADLLALDPSVPTPSG